MKLDSIPNLRKIVYKKHNNKFLWHISLLGKEIEVDGRKSREKDRKFIGETLEEALSALKE